MDWLTYLDIGDHAVELFIFDCELPGLEDDHFVDEVGLPELFVVRNIFIVFGCFYICILRTGGCAAQPIRLIELIDPLTLNLNFTETPHLFLNLPLDLLQRTIRSIIVHRQRIINNINKVCISYLIVLRPVLYILSMLQKKNRQQQNNFLRANKTLVMNLLADDLAKHS